MRMDVFENMEGIYGDIYIYDVCLMDRQLAPLAGSLGLVFSLSTYLPSLPRCTCGYGISCLKVECTSVLKLSIT